MDKTHYALIIIVAVLLILVVSNFQGFLPVPVFINEADIIIKVVDEFTGNPVIGAKVSLDGGSEVLTSSDGTVDFRAVEFGEHRIRVEYKGQVRDNVKIIVSSTENSFDINIPVPKEINVKILDTETGKPVRNQEVYLNNKKIGPTTQDGNIKIKDIMPGDYLISLDKVVTIPSTQLSVLRDKNSYSVSVNMPNPFFTVAGKLESAMMGGDTNKAIVEITNTGQIPSEGTIAVILEYQDDNGKAKLIDKDIISFGEISPTGIPREEESRPLSNPWFVYEDIVIIVFDKNEYIPEKDWSLELSVPKDAVTAWISGAVNYCTENARDCAEIAGVFAGDLIKTLIA